ncbi:MAG: prohibitin family protein [Planctomycetota bacterium]
MSNLNLQRDAGFPPGAAKLVPVVVVILLLIFGATRCIKVIDAGHVGVAKLFGSVQEEPYAAGFHIVNPLLSWEVYDARQKTHKETAGVPSQDQLTTQVDVSVQYRINGAMAPQVLADTGTAEQAVEVHLVPKVRSLLREQGKGIVRAEDFFREETQQKLQTSLQVGLEEFLTPKGITVTDVLIRDIQLPQRLIAQIEQKKEVEQQAERQKAELQRFETEQQQLVVQQKAQREAAEEEAARRKVIADAQAYEITQINEAIAESPAYIQLQALDALKAISENPASQIYFLDGSSPAPLPLMNLGKGLATPAAR